MYSHSECLNESSHLSETISFVKSDTHALLRQMHFTDFLKLFFLAVSLPTELNK